MSARYSIDRTKFNRKGGIVCSWSPDARKWFCAWFPDWVNDGLSDEPKAAGEGDDPLEAFIAMLEDLGALEPGSIQ